MTRHNRHLNIVKNFGDRRYDRHVQYHFEVVIARLGLTALTDDAVRLFATELVRGRARQKRYNAENRKLMARAS